MAGRTGCAFQVNPSDRCVLLSARGKGHVHLQVSGNGCGDSYCPLSSSQENPAGAHHHTPRLYTCSSSDKLCADVTVWGQLSGGSHCVGLPRPALVHLHLPEQQIGTSSWHHTKCAARRLWGNGSRVQYATQTSVLFLLVPLHALKPILGALVPYVQETSEVEIQQVFKAQGAFW